MRIKFLAFVGMVWLSQSVFSQEIGSVINGTHTITVVKSNELYTCLYSDISNSKEVNLLKSFHFINKKSVFDIIIKGFQNQRNHQVIVQANSHTILKFDYKSINGEVFLKIRHNNLNEKVSGESTFLTFQQVLNLFGENTAIKA